MIAYVLFGIALASAMLFTSPWIVKVGAAAATSGDEPSAELRELLTSSRIRTLLILDMVMKPLPERIF